MNESHSRFSARSLALLFATFAAACSFEGPSTEDASEANVTTTQSDYLTFEEYWDRYVRPSDDGHGFDVEGDMFAADEDAVRRHYHAAVPTPGALTVRTIASGDDIWSRTDRVKIKYCVDKTSLGTEYDRVVDFMHKAVSAWESAADVRMQHVSSQDSTCTHTNANVTFDVYSDPTKGKKGRKGFPSDLRSDASLRLGDVGGTQPGASPWTDKYLLALLMHELGHGLGFRHEHIRDPAVTPGCTEGTDWRQLTPYDGVSVMHYPTCPGWTDPLRDENFITQWDVEGAQSVYEAPTNVVNATDGSIYARKRSTGDFYKLSGASWTKIGGPGQAFVAVDSTIYGQEPNRGRPVKYTSGSGWTVIGAAAGQIFECANKLCATDPNTGDIARYSGSGQTWTKIGGPGSRFRATTTQIFGIEPLQHSIALWSGSGQSWTTVGDGACELFGGGSSMYRLTEDKKMLQKYTSGTTWETVSGAARNFVATGSKLYKHSLSGGQILKYDGSGNNWTKIHASAAKIYGANGSVYATSVSDEGIEMYTGSGSSWIDVGKP